ncbi:iron complex transport system ATP-binding protein [Desulfocicer vacuolatum DSM 3385]|uniref:Iron complex transport system ATP-binding protein n=1 Tax=Desulfocicer vacuolatum DSM 3385 TaxID=1121400 RepID=A0A1W2DQ20_9BACT|nr:ABC transporter ATP-binding protein [Desulfocicer vacuolatum]SMC99524.1 iron complex transport system ATP-binding protein [Desulfocicer vacuolatum DSM 3385]
MLSVNNICFAYNNTKVLDEISFHLGKGELCGLFGPNGSGKTTLFKCCLKFIRPDRGSVRFNGRDIKKFKTREMAKQVAYVPQTHQPPFPFTVKEMVLMGRTPHLNRFYLPGNRDKKLMEQAMEMINISHLADEPYDILSGGQQQMVLIARALAQNTDLILLDEPTSALDFKNQVIIWKALRRIADQGISILACSHDPNHVAWFCDTTVVLGNSGLIANGDPDRVLCQDLMDKIYENTCLVRDLEDMKMIVPKGLNRHRAQIIDFPITGTS